MQKMGQNKAFLPFLGHPTVQVVLGQQEGRQVGNVNVTSEVLIYIPDLIRL